VERLSLEDQCMRGGIPTAAASEKETFCGQKVIRVGSVSYWLYERKRRFPGKGITSEALSTGRRSVRDEK